MSIETQNITEKKHTNPLDSASGNPVEEKRDQAELPADERSDSVAYENILTQVSQGIIPSNQDIARLTPAQKLKLLENIQVPAEIKTRLRDDPVIARQEIVSKINDPTNDPNGEMLSALLRDFLLKNTQGLGEGYASIGRDLEKRKEQEKNNQEYQQSVTRFYSKVADMESYTRSIQTTLNTIA